MARFYGRDNDDKLAPEKTNNKLKVLLILTFISHIIGSFITFMGSVLLIIMGMPMPIYTFKTYIVIGLSFIPLTLILAIISHIIRNRFEKKLISASG